MSTPEGGGLRAASRAAVGSGLDYSKARGALLRLEAEEARAKLRLIGRLAATGLILFTAGYALLLVIAAGWLASVALAGNRTLAYAALGGFHLLVGGILLFGARVRSRRMKLFRESAQQLELDRQWIQDLQETIKNRR